MLASFKSSCTPADVVGKTRRCTAALSVTTADTAIFSASKRHPSIPCGLHPVKTDAL